MWVTIWHGEVVCVVSENRRMRHATHPFFAIWSQTHSLNMVKSVPVGFSNFLMRDLVVAVDDARLEEKYVKEVVEGFGNGRPRCSPAFGW